MNLKTVTIADLEPHPDNPNTHPMKQIDALADSLTKFTQVKNVVIWNDRIIAGHGVIEAAKKAGILTLAAQDVSHWPEDKATQFMLADIRLPDMGFFDEAAMAEALRDVEEPLEIPGIDEEFLKGLEGWKVKEPKEDEGPDVDKADELQELWQTEVGQIWSCGPHRVACGDCTDRGMVEGLMRGERADCLIADPPYGMNLDTSYSNSTDNVDKGIKKSRGYKKIIGDDVPFDPTPLFDLFSAIQEQFYWGADYYRDKLPNGGSWLVWDKRASIEDIKYSNSEFELCWSKKRHHRIILRVPWFGIIGTEQQDVQSRLHPTQKPLGVITPIIEKYCDDLILDPFLGSGTTMVAAHQLGRRCFGIELSPSYVAVCLQRFFDLSDVKPHLITNIRPELTK